QFLFVRQNGKTKICINIPAETFLRLSESMRLLLELEQLFAFKGHASRAPEFHDQEETPTHPQWDNIVAKAKQAIEHDELQKVVLARKKVLYSNSPLRPDDLLDHLTTRANEHFI